MEPDRSAALGQFLRARREKLGLSTRQLSALARVNDVTIVRIERGEFAAPRPDKLSRLADALGVRLSDVFAMADYVAPNELPTLSPYLQVKYPRLPDEAVAAIGRYAARTAKRHGVTLDSPLAAEPV
jgi:transcriptional regulator with XRE-family HTH domain